MLLRLVGVVLVAVGLALLRGRRRAAGIWARNRAGQLDQAQLLNGDLAERLRAGLTDTSGLQLARIQACAFAVFLIAAGLALITGLAA